MKPTPDDDAGQRVLFQLKTRGPQTAAALAARLGVSAVAARQQLAALAARGEVDFEEQRGARGRPARRWRITAAGSRRFPESYAELSLELLEAMRAAFGAEGLERLVAARTAQQARAYRARLPGDDAPLQRQVAALARLRTAEGYMAQSARQRDGSWLLVERHCPICDAARACQGLCAGELELFRRALGRGVTVERVEHLLAGDARCAYRVAPR